MVKCSTRNESKWIEVEYFNNPSIIEKLYDMTNRENWGVSNA